MNGNSITGFKDTDRIVIQNMDTRSFLNTYQIKNKYIHSLFTEDMFKYRVEKEFPKLIHVRGNKTWKQFYLELTHWANLLIEKFNYHGGFEYHPQTYYYIIKEWFDKLDENNKREIKDFEKRFGSKFGSPEYMKAVLNSLLIYAAGFGFIDLVEYAIEQGADNYEDAISEADLNGEDETMDYLERFLV